jgi:hypothetical protein
MSSLYRTQIFGQTSEQMIEDDTNRVEFIGRHQDEVYLKFMASYVQQRCEEADDNDEEWVNVEQFEADFRKEFPIRLFDHHGMILFETENKVLDRPIV